MRDDWLDMSMGLAVRRADFYSGARKIIRNVHRTLTRPPLLGSDPEHDLTLADCGFRSAKMRMLERNYFVRESIDAAKKLWEGRISKKKYGSVGFTCYGHYVKGGGHRSFFAEHHAKKRAESEGKEYKIGRASVMGPCIQAVTLTYMPKGTCSIDIFYRTTELFKKFPADLVFLRDVLLPSFELERTPVESLNMHFANVTCHPMYFVTLIPCLDDPIAALETLRKKDLYFFNWCVKWTARYLVPEYFRGIEKFAQAMRVRKDALARIDKSTMRELVQYLKKHHPGYRNKYEEPEEGEE